MEKKLKNTYQSPRWTGEIADCTMPMTFDTYSNCAFGCVYCFSQFQRGIGKGAEDYKHKRVESVNVDKVKKIFSGEDKNNQFYEYIKNRRTVQYGGLSDEFDWFEKKYGVTYEILKYLKSINYPLCFSTKGTFQVFDPKYRELFKGQDNWNMKFSIVTLDPEIAKIVEPGVPSPQERLKAIHEYTTLNKGGATLRLRPFIPGISDKTYLDLIREAHKAGATAVTTEFLCIELRSINQAKKNYEILSKLAGFDIVEFYKKYSNGSGYLRLNRKVKEKYIKNMRDLCHQLGMRFYVSDAHFKECCDNGCCCGLPNSYDYTRGNFSGALQIAKKTGKVRWSDIEKDMGFLNFDYNSAIGFNKTSSENSAKFQNTTMKGYLHYLWDNPKRGQSPYKIFEGVLKPDGVDENGDIIYKYDDSVTFIKHEEKESIDVLKV